jgi:hypothetical protein
MRSIVAAVAAAALTCISCSGPLQHVESPLPGAVRAPAAAAPAPASRPSVTPSSVTRSSAAPAQAQAARPAIAPLSTLPNDKDSVKFLVIGDTGTGGRAQYEVGQRIADAYKSFPFEFAIMLGDNLYGSEGPSAYVNKFEKPYKPLLDAGVKFYASLGNHDEPAQRFYKPFNMDGKRFYSFSKGDIEFFVLDSTYMTPAQVDWLKSELEKSDKKWKISYSPSDLLVGREAWVGSRSAGAHRTAVRAERRRRRLRRPRALLRAPEAAEGDPLHHAGRRRQAARGEHPRQLADDRKGVRHRQLLHARRGVEGPDVLRNDLAPWAGRRLGRDYPPRGGVAGQRHAIAARHCCRRAQSSPARASAASTLGRMFSAPT